ncbi:MAG TPA: CBS domain-containing protein [Polyangia bacterium]|jgi:acetoin utilization protein AcuB|nr:CBS domain-containing protein [Polyangia bacterium]
MVAKRLTIRNYMTASPITIGLDQSLAAAHAVMREHRIRHLPVLEQGRLVGIVTERDLHLVETLRDVDPASVQVEEAMTPDPYAISPETSLEWVVSEMAEHKYGAAVVIDGRNKVLGVFTTVDAMHALQDLLADERRRRRHEDAPAAGKRADTGC